MLPLLRPEQFRFWILPPPTQLKDTSWSSWILDPSLVHGHPAARSWILDPSLVHGHPAARSWILDWSMVTQLRGHPGSWVTLYCTIYSRLGAASSVVTGHVIAEYPPPPFTCSSSPSTHTHTAHHPPPIHPPIPPPPLPIPSPPSPAPHPPPPAHSPPPLTCLLPSTGTNLAHEGIHCQVSPGRGGRRGLRVQATLWWVPSCHGSSCDLMSWQ